MTISFLSLAACSLFISNLVSIAGQDVGVNYGLLGDNLPPPNEVVSLLKSRSISRVRLFNPNGDVLKALEGSGIEVTLGTLNGDLPNLASNLTFASQWTQDNILPHAGNVTFRYICVGNEVIPGELGNFVLPAIQNMYAAFAAASLKIHVTTAIAMTVLNNSYPPSQGTFSEDASPIMAPLISFLASKNTSLLVNVYPYFAYVGSAETIQLDYVQFTATSMVVHDGSLGYKNLFDAMVDGVYSAMEKVGGHDVEIVVSESGWPSAGAAEASIEYARIYNNNLVAHINSVIGTPKRPGKAIGTYLFAIFNENLKPAGTEQNFGLYKPDMSEVYHVNLSM